MVKVKFGMELAINISKINEREVREMENVWKYRGRMDNGEAVYWNTDGRLAVEKDHRTLVEPKPSELYEIFQYWPELADFPARKKSTFPVENVVDTGALKDTIIDLEFEASEHRSIIEALKYSNDERDKMIVTLMDDIQDLKGQIDTLHDTNRKWKEEVARRDGTIDALMAQIKEGEYLNKE